MQGTRSSGRWQAIWWPAAALVALVALVYWPGRHGGFVFDDLQNITANPWLGVTTLDWRDWMLATFSSPASDLSRPLAMFTFAVNHYFTGMAAMPMKLTNIAIHAANALLVLVLVRRLLSMAPLAGVEASRREWAARFAAAAWALHPINLMAVLYVVQRMESLSHMFVFAGLWLYLLGRARQQAGRNGWPLVLGGVIGGTLLGLLAKESSVLLPLYALLVEFFVLRFRTTVTDQDRRLYWMYGAVLVLPGVLGVAWLTPHVLSAGAWASRDFDLAQRLWTEARVILDYLHWTILPDLGQLSLYHDDYRISRGWFDPPMTAVALLALATLTALAVAVRKVRPLTGLGIGWFLGAHLLTATFLPLELVFEHRNYFASFGVCLVLTDLLLLWPRQPDTRRVGVLLAVLFVAGMAALTTLRSLEWSNPIQFYRSEVMKHPTSARATFEWARTVINMTRMDPASPLLPEAWRALEQARDAPGSGSLPHQAALILAARTGSLEGREDWWEDMWLRLRTLPRNAGMVNSVTALTDCATEGRCRFNPGHMMRTYEAALHRGPHATILAAYGKYALYVLDDRPLALQLWRDAVARSPREASFRYNLARLLLLEGDQDGAREQIAVIRQSGRMGQYEALAIELESRLDNAESDEKSAPHPR